MVSLGTGFNENSIKFIFTYDNSFKNAVCKMLVISFQRHEGGDPISLVPFGDQTKRVIASECQVCVTATLSGTVKDVTY